MLILPHLKFSLSSGTDHEAAYLRLHQDYFEDDCVYPIILPPEVPYVKKSFPKHYAQA
jgi:hypothetical protein